MIGSGRATANGYITQQQPWALRKTDPARMAAVLRAPAHGAPDLRHRAPALHAGHAWRRLLDQLGVPERGAGASPRWRRRCRAARRCRRRSRCSARSTPPRKHVRTSMLIDSHCHLDYFDEAEIEAVDRARARGRGRADGDHRRRASTSRRRSGAGRALPEQVWATVGVHPHTSASAPLPSVEELLALADHPRVIGIGESGLDYFYDKAPREVQRRASAGTSGRAQRSGLPLVIHARDADEDIAGHPGGGARGGRAVPLRAALLLLRRARSRRRRCGWAATCPSPAS